MNSRGLEGQCSVCSNSLKTNMKIKLIPQLHVATRQQSSDAKAETPLEQRAPSTSELLKVSGYPTSSGHSPDRSDCNHSRGLCTATSGGHLPHSLEDTLLYAEDEQERGLQYKAKAQPRSLRETWSSCAIDEHLNNFCKIFFLSQCLLVSLQYHVPVNSLFLSMEGQRTMQTRSSNPVKSWTIFYIIYKYIIYIYILNK